MSRSRSSRRGTKRKWERCYECGYTNTCVWCEGRRVQAQRALARRDAERPSEIRESDTHTADGRESGE